MHFGRGRKGRLSSELSSDWSTRPRRGFARRWEAFFGNAMDAADDVSDSVSVFSVERSVRSVRQRGVLKASDAVATSVAGSARKLPRRSDKPVSSLRPKRPVVMSSDG